MDTYLVLTAAGKRTHWRQHTYVVMAACCQHVVTFGQQQLQLSVPVLPSWEGPFTRPFLVFILCQCHVCMCRRQRTQMPWSKPAGMPMCSTWNGTMWLHNPRTRYMKEVLSNEQLMGPLKTAISCFNWMGEATVPVLLLKGVAHVGSQTCVLTSCMQIMRLTWQEAKLLLP